jgi:hypothetical protein
MAVGCEGNSLEGAAKSIARGEGDKLSLVEKYSHRGDDLLHAIATETDNFATWSGSCSLSVAHLLSIHRSEYATSVARSFATRSDSISRALADTYGSCASDSTVDDIRFSLDYVRSYDPNPWRWDEEAALMICAENLSRVTDDVCLEALRDVLPRLETKQSREAVEQSLRKWRMEGGLNLHTNQ